MKQHNLNLCEIGRVELEKDSWTVHNVLHLASRYTGASQIISLHTEIAAPLQTTKMLCSIHLGIAKVYNLQCDAPKNATVVTGNTLLHNS